MLKSNTSRRDMLKVSAALAGAASVMPSSLTAGTNASNSANLAPSVAVEAQNRFIQQLLIKHAAGSKTTRPEDIEAFAKRFTEINGVIDYQAEFSTIDGEYRITRAFVKSLRVTQTNPAA